MSSYLSWHLISTPIASHSSLEYDVRGSKSLLPRAWTGAGAKGPATLPCLPPLFIYPPATMLLVCSMTTVTFGGLYPVYNSVPCPAAWRMQHELSLSAATARYCYGPLVDRFAIRYCHRREPTYGAGKPTLEPCRQASLWIVALSQP